MDNNMRHYMRIVESGTALPRVVDDGGDVAHAKFAMFDENGAAYIRFWKVRDGRIVVQSMKSSAQVRGRDMVKWLGQTYRLPVVAVEATPEALGFWERMQDEGLIQSFEETDGFPTPLEDESVPL
jgi:hypothetical protein